MSSSAGEHADIRLRRVAQLFRKHVGSADRLLDLGCGNGEITVFLASQLGAREVYGVEVSPAQAKIASSKGIECLEFDLNRNRIPLPDAFFDAVFCGDLIEHVLDPDRLLDEIHRILSDRGGVVLTTGNLAMWLNRITLPLLGWQPLFTEVSMRYNVGMPGFLTIAEEPRNSDTAGDYGHIRLPTHAALLELIRLHSFDILEVRGAPLATPAQVKAHAPEKRLRSALYTLFYPLDFLAALTRPFAARLIVAFRKK